MYGYLELCRTRHQGIVARVEPEDQGQFLGGHLLQFFSSSFLA